VDADGSIVTGFLDGRVVRIAADGASCKVLGHTAGRPLGVRVQADGSVLVADANRGLLRVAAGVPVEVLASDADAIRFGFTDDLDVDGQGRTYFTDASWKFGFGHHVEDSLEHGAKGRLLRYDPAQKRADTLMAALQFANGVALGPGGQYVLIDETTEYKVTRLWLLGDKAGTKDTYVENLAGFPDNITFNGSDRFWVAMFAPRDALLDKILPLPFVRSMVMRLPAFLQVQPKRMAFIAGLDLDGHVVEQYQFDGPGAFGPITSVREKDGVLYLGSLGDTAIGKVSLAELRGTGPASAPPAPVSARCE
jgi:sugar lactone lactonase YvrE